VYSRVAAREALHCSLTKVRTAVCNSGLADSNFPSVRLRALRPDASRVIVAGEPFTEQLIGPSSAAWGRGPTDYGRVAYVSTDGGTTAPPPDGKVGPAKVLRVEFGDASPR